MDKNFENVRELTKEKVPEILEKMHELEGDFPISAEKVIIRFLPEIALSLAVIADRLKDIDSVKGELHNICDCLDEMSGIYHRR